jgi:hypothetical protein
MKSRNIQSEITRNQEVQITLESLHDGRLRLNHCSTNLRGHKKFKGRACAEGLMHAISCPPDKDLIFPTNESEESYVVKRGETRSFWLAPTKTQTSQPDMFVTYQDDDLKRGMVDMSTIAEPMFMHGYKCGDASERIKFAEYQGKRALLVTVTRNASDDTTIMQFCGQRPDFNKTDTLRAQIPIDAELRRRDEI